MMSDSPPEPSPERPVISRKRQSVINIIAQYVGVGLMMLQGILLTPLYLKYITPSLYGAWLASGNILGWIAMVDPGISRILQQRTAFIFGRGEMKLLGGVIGTGLFLGTALSLLPLIAIPFSSHIVSILKLSPAEHAELTTAFQWGLVSTSLMIAVFQPCAVNLGVQCSLSAGVSIALATLIGIISTFLMLHNGVGLLAIPLGLTIRAVLMLAFSLALMVRWCERNLRGLVRVDRSELRSYTTLSVLTFMERFVTALLTQSDVFLAARVVSNEAAVLYSLTGRAIEPVRSFAEKLMPAFIPGIAHLAGEGNPQRLQEIARRLLNVVAFIIAVGAACVVAMNFVFVKLWVGPQFFGGERLTLLFSALAVTNVIFLCLSDITFAVGGVGPIETLRVAEGIVRIVLQLILLKQFGLVGIPMGGCLGMLLVSGLYLPGIAAKKLGADRRQLYVAVATQFLRSMVLMLCGLAAWYFLSRNISVWTWPRFFACGAVVGIVFGSIGLAMSPPMRDELRRLKARLRARQTP